MFDKLMMVTVFGQTRNGKNSEEMTLGLLQKSNLGVWG